MKGTKNKTENGVERKKERATKRAGINQEQRRGGRSRELEGANKEMLKERPTGLCFVCNGQTEQC